MSKKYRVMYLPVAQDDLFEIFDYIHRDDPEAATEFVERIDRALSKLQTHPLLGPVPKDERLEMMGYRILVVDNYIAFYAVKGNVVEIRRVLHGSRKYSFLLE